MIRGPPQAPRFHGLILGTQHPLLLFVCFGPGFFVRLSFHVCVYIAGYFLTLSGVILGTNH